MIMTATETEGKSSDVKDKGLVKSKGSSGNTGLASGKSGDGGKAASGSANDGASQRCAVYYLQIYPYPLSLFFQIKNLYH